MTEGSKRESKLELEGPKKNFKSVQEREQELIDSVDQSHRLSLQNLVREYRDVFPEQLPKGRLPKRDVEHTIKVEPGSKPPNRPPYRFSPQSRAIWSVRSRTSFHKDLFVPDLHPTEHKFCSSLKRTADGGCASIIEH